MTRVRIATFNLLHGVVIEHGAARAPDLAAAAKSLDADIVGLQEVDRCQVRSGGVDQAALVAESLGAAHHRFVPALHGTPGPVRCWTPAHVDDGSLLDEPTYGVALVSRLPVRAWFVRRFPPARFAMPLLVSAVPRPRLAPVPDEPRVAVAAVVDGPAGPFTVVTAHLSFVPGTNARQLRAVTGWATTFPAPRLLAGDVNLPGTLPRRLTGWHQLGRVATYPSYAPRVQFDHVLADGLSPDAVRGVHAVRLPVSDHCALVVDVDL